MYADMVGYSRLIGLDDQGTLDRFRALRRDVIDPAIAEHGGRLIQTGGDSLLVVFDSIDGAVRCAIKVQREMPTHDADQPSDRTMRFRIGINIGDTIADGTDLHGDAVNIAARLQAKCPPGSICITRGVCDHLQEHLGLEFEELGLLDLKNIARPVEAFVLRSGRDPSSLHNTSVRNVQAPHGRPRLSVLVGPIESQGFPGEEEHLARGITEDVTADLARLAGAFVVGSDREAAVGSSLTHAARQLGINYVVQGSIRKASEHTTIATQLIRADSGAHIWSERFQIGLKELLDTPDEITGRLVRAITTKLVEDLDRQIGSIPHRDWTADDFVIHGRSFLIRPFSQSNRLEALSHFERALTLDEKCVAAKLAVANVLVSNVLDGWSSTPEHDKQRADRLLRGILDDNGEDADARTYMGMLRRLQGRLTDARIELEMAVALAPSNVHAIGQLGITLTFLGEPETAIPLILRCLRLAPHDRNTPTLEATLGLCRILLGEVDKAIVHLRKARLANPQLYYIHAFLAAALALHEETDEAADVLREVVRIRPEFASQSDLQTVLRESSPEYLRLWRSTVYKGLIRAGLPEIVPNFAPLPD
jgi:class 3 adenylate cyclase/TolB-like protein/tetratricopeptide (TPR) repeat protein